MLTYEGQELLVYWEYIWDEINSERLNQDMDHLLKREEILHFLYKDFVSYGVAQMWMTQWRIGLEWLHIETPEHLQILIDELDDAFTEFEG